MRGLLLVLTCFFEEIVWNIYVLRQFTVRSYAAASDLTNSWRSLEKNKALGTEEFHDELIKIIEENPKAPFGALMGIAVKKLRGKASGQKISDMLQELLEGHKSMKGEKKVR